MEANKYQELAFGTAHGPYEDASRGLPLAILALGGEVGELQNEMKKVIEGKKEMDTHTFLQELGDVVWYVAMVATQLGTSLSDVMDMNLAKLAKRYKERNESIPSSNVQPEGTDESLPGGIEEPGTGDNQSLAG